ncbi:Short C-terminal domain-containing protein [Dethiosulfatibacter aminovorans DSM 17477]|uniref:Short C-terminal domain-containing protein n=1 Tax=Dethiosulfatibacter aminovorans DSM 17477 TaxID=1121476 RepID=A0A1M6MIT8_9FIRM|nr:SHOCT domain-containing protein [Dethiosulfatibacter aminovorans]SHJ83421.1 Short C-terminal domain-containing protein [Dethiosulfatibacter aminovorans DSM 17477]
MHGYWWFGSESCPFWGGYRYLSFWHFGVMIGVVIGVVALIIWAIKRYKINSNNALASLKLLYVNGDITEEEYLKRKNVIERK